MMKADLTLGQKKLDWARSHMPVHAELRRRYGASQPFKGLVFAVGSHLEAKTGVFIETLAAAGAEVVFTGSVAATTQDDVVEALSQQSGIHGYARHGISDDESAKLHAQVLEHGPHFILDDAAELTARLVHEFADRVPALVGMCEQTATGVQRLKAIEREGGLNFPAYAVNDTPMKHDFDNVHGTGESSLTNLLLTTNLLLAGKRTVVAGYGYCGQGVAQKAKGWGARVTVTEVDPRKALRAHMAGFEIAPMERVITDADFVITTTGNRDILRPEHFERMKDGVVIANAGHFSVEVDTHGLADMAAGKREVRPGITEYVLADERRINVVANAELVNLAAPTSMGHPAEVMDQTFAMQFMAALHLIEHRDQLTNGVHVVPDDVDRQVAEIKLTSLGIGIDSMTDSQRRYLDSWKVEDIKNG